MNKMPKKQTIPDKVYSFLKDKKKALQKKQICEQMDLSKSAVDRACTILRKQKKIGYMKSCWGICLLRLIGVLNET